MITTPSAKNEPRTSREPADKRVLHNPKQTSPSQNDESQISKGIQLFRGFNFAPND